MDVESLRSSLSRYGDVNSNNTVLQLQKSIDKLNLSYNDLFRDVSILYFTKNYGQVIQVSTEEKAQFKLVSFILSSDNVVYFMFVRNYKGWKGVAFGSLEYLYARMQQPGINDYCSDDFLEYLYESLLNKEKWKVIRNGCYLDYSRLKTYLILLCAIVKRKMIVSEESQDLLLNATKTKIIFDSNLLDKYGNKIYIMHTISKEDEGNLKIRFVKPYIVRDMDTLYHHGFDVELYKKLLPLKLYSSPEDLIFCGEMCDFVLNDTYLLKHLFEDRKDRLPKSIRTMTSAAFSFSVKSSLEYAVKMSKVDYQYVKPSFSLLEMKPVFLMPLYQYIGDNKPLGALVVSRYEKNWKIYTVLSLEQAYISARAIAPVTGWLEL